MKISEGEYWAASEEMNGYCKACDDITTGCVEPDARRYPCECCGARTVYGIEEALLMGLLELE